MPTNEKDFPSRPWLKFYPEDIPHSIDYPELPVFDLLTQASALYPSKTALRYFGRNISFVDLNREANHFANGLVSLGITKGDKVALMLPNVPQFVVCFFGALKAGATVVPFNPLYREKEIEFQLKDSGTKAAVILANVVGKNNFYEEFGKTRSKLPLEHVFVTSVTDYLPPMKRALAGPVKKIKTLGTENTISLVEFLRKQSPNEPDTPSLSINPKEDLAVIQYTGGTTGISKGAMLTHYNLVSNAIASAVWTGLSNEDVLLAVIPFFHIYGLTGAMLCSIYRGTTIVMLPSFNAQEVLETIDKEKVSVFPGVPTIYVALINDPNIKKYSLKTIRNCVSGAAALPAEVQKKFNELTGGNLVEGYGLTEASPVTHSNILRRDAPARSGSIGIPFPNTEARIVDFETGSRELTNGEIGELAVKGPQVMKGYWNSKEETERVLKDGWLLTGDIAREDADGFFYIVDRKKDMIDASGFKVWPRDVEEVLFSHPAVKEAAAVGINDEYRGETVKAFVVLKDDQKGTVTEEEIRAYCRSQMAPYKVPRIIEFRDDLPKSLIGKVLRRKLKEEDSAKNQARAPPAKSA